MVATCCVGHDMKIGTEVLTRKLKLRPVNDQTTNDVVTTD